MPAGARSRSSRKPVEIVGGDRLLEPAHAACSANRSAEPAPACGRTRRWRRRTARRRGRSPRAPRATRARSAAGSRPIFIFTRGMPSSTQPPSCSRSRSIEYEVKPPLPYTGTASRDSAEQRDERQVEQPRLEVPQRDVHGGDRHRGDAGRPEVADRLRHAPTHAPRRPSRRGRRRRRRASSSNQRAPVAVVGVGVAEAGAVAAGGRRRATSVVASQANRAVRLGRVGRDRGTTDDVEALDAGSAAGVRGGMFRSPPGLVSSTTVLMMSQRSCSPRSSAFGEVAAPARS